MKVLFVCTGNLCRSPMAEAMLRQQIMARKIDGVELASAGTWAIVGSPATHDAIGTLSALGIDLTSHRSRHLSPEALQKADLVVAMTSVHIREIAELAPETLPKVRLLKELPEIHPAGRGADARSRLQALLAGERPEPRRGLDVDDPIGLGPGAYQRCVRDLEAGVEAIMRLLD